METQVYQGLPSALVPGLCTGNYLAQHEAVVCNSWDLAMYGSVSWWEPHGHDEAEEGHVCLPELSQLQAPVPGAQHRCPPSPAEAADCTSGASQNLALGLGWAQADGGMPQGRDIAGPPGGALAS